MSIGTPAKLLSSSPIEGSISAIAHDAAQT